MPLNIVKEQVSPFFSSIGHVLGIAAGKGGVGKSSVTVNLALALQKFGFTIGIIDADVYGPSVKKMLPEDRKPVQKGKQIIPAESKGIKIISMAYFRKEDEAAAVRAPIANGIIAQFIHNIDWGKLDILLIDFPPGTGDIQLTLAQQAQLSGAIMVTTPQEVSMLDVKKAINLFNQVNIPIIGIVENMSYYFHQKTEEQIYLFGKGGGEKLALEYKVPLLEKIPIDPLVSQSGDEGFSLFNKDSKRKHSASAAFMDLAEKVIMQLKERSGENNIELSWEKEANNFSIKWLDGTLDFYRLSELQQNCPCANCVDESTGKRKKEFQGNQEVKAINITKVGHYGLRIQFTSGCSSGIYGFDQLYQMARGMK